MSQTLFRQAVGDTPKVRIIEFLAEGREIDYSLSDIAEGAGIGRTTLFRAFPSLQKAGIVVHTREIGNAKLYRINLNNEFASRLIKLFDREVSGALAEPKAIRLAR